MRSSWMGAQHVLIGGQELGKTHARNTAFGVQAVEHSPPKVRFFSTMRIGQSRLEQEKCQGKDAGSLPRPYRNSDL